MSHVTHMNYLWHTHQGAQQQAPDWQHCNSAHDKLRHANQTLKPTATHCNTLPPIATHCKTLQHTATHCSTLQHTATLCNTPQHTATAADTRSKLFDQRYAPAFYMQHTATHCNSDRRPTGSSSDSPPKTCSRLLCATSLSTRTRCWK